MNSKSKLSSNVLQMKFMQRSVLRIEKEKNEEERKHIVDDEHWVLDLPDTKEKESKYLVEPSFSRCENLCYGRMSFKGFNPEVEKLMKSQGLVLDLEESERKEAETSVGDEEMAERYENLVGTIAKKFAKKKQVNSSSEEPPEKKIKVKREFIKPADD